MVPVPTLAEVPWALESQVRVKKTVLEKIQLFVTCFLVFGNFVASYIMPKFVYCTVFLRMKIFPSFLLLLQFLLSSFFLRIFGHWFWVISVRIHVWFNRFNLKICLNSMLELAIRERYVTCDIVVTYLRYAATGACTGCCARGAGFPPSPLMRLYPFVGSPPPPPKAGGRRGGD